MSSKTLETSSDTSPCLSFDLMYSWMSMQAALYLYQFNMPLASQGSSQHIVTVVGIALLLC